MKSCLKLTKVFFVMCWSEKCCYYVPANLGCVFVGTCGFILSTFMLVSSIVFFVIQPEEDVQQLSVHKAHVTQALGLSLNAPSLHIILSIAIIISVLWMLFSVLLIVGVIKNKPCCVLSYFSFGIIITILCQLSALLLLLNNCWIMALILFICSLIHIHFLVVVHTVYDLMQSGKDFRLHQHHQEDEDPLADCFDTNTDNML